MPIFSSAESNQKPRQINNSFELVFESNLGFRSLLAVDQVWGDADLENLAFVVFHKSNKTSSLEWTSTSNGFLLQDNLGQQTIFFRTKSREWAEMALVKLRLQQKLNRKSSRNSAFFSIFASSAYAQTIADNGAFEKHGAPKTCASSASVGHSSVSSLAAVPINASSKMSLLLKCAEQMGSGALGSVNGAVASAEEFFNSPQVFFDKVAKSFENLKSFVENIKFEFQSLQRLFAELDAKQVQEILCTWVGSLGVNALMAIAAGGASAYLLLKAVKSLHRMVLLLQTSLRLNRLHISHDFRGSGFLKEALACSY